MNTGSWHPITGEFGHCESCHHFTRWPGPPRTNCGTCAELKRLKLKSIVTIPGQCVVDGRIALETELTRRLATVRDIYAHF